MENPNKTAAHAAVGLRTVVACAPAEAPGLIPGEANTEHFYIVSGASVCDFGVVSDFEQRMGYCLVFIISSFNAEHFT